MIKRQREDEVADRNQETDEYKKTERGRNKSETWKSKCKDTKKAAVKDWCCSFLSINKSHAKTNNELILQTIFACVAETWYNFLLCAREFQNCTKNIKNTENNVWTITNKKAGCYLWPGKKTSRKERNYLLALHDKLSNINFLRINLISTIAESCHWSAVVCSFFNRNYIFFCPLVLVASLLRSLEPF